MKQFFINKLRPILLGLFFFINVYFKKWNAIMVYTHFLQLVIHNIILHTHTVQFECTYTYYTIYVEVYR